MQWSGPTGARFMNWSAALDLRESDDDDDETEEPDLLNPRDALHLPPSLKKQLDADDERASWTAWPGSLGAPTFSIIWPYGAPAPDDRDERGRNGEEEDVSTHPPPHSARRSLATRPRSRRTTTARGGHRLTTIPRRRRGLASARA